MCGIDFVMGVTDKEAAKADKYVHYNERLRIYLLKKEANENIKNNLILRLDPFKQTIIYTKDIPELIKTCEDLFNNYKLFDDIENDIRSFAIELINLCKEALALKKHIYAIGD